MLEAFCPDQGNGVIGTLRRFDALKPKAGLVTASLKGIEARGGEQSGHDLGLDRICDSFGRNS